MHPDHEYLRKRGLSPETIAHFGLGYCKRGVMATHIAIPVRNAEGRIVAYARRHPSLDDDTPKYKYPSGFLKTLELFNFHEAKQQPSEQPLVIVEGFFDVFNLWQLGQRRVVATMGSSPSEQQLEAILKLGRGDRVVVLYDDDDAGTTGMDLLLDALEGHAYVLVPSFPDGITQPDQLTAEHLRSMIP